MKRGVLTSEQVSCGHPDKICDQISDAIVTAHLAQDRAARVAVETMAKSYGIVLAGEVTSNAEVNYKEIVHDVLRRIGLDDWEQYETITMIAEQSTDIAMGVDTGGAGDQGIMFGYATNETAEMLPLPFVLATRALIDLRERDWPFLLPDAKSQVSYDYDTGRITTFLISSQHTEDAFNLSADRYETRLERAAHSVMESLVRRYGLNRDYRRLVNPTGAFLQGGTHADAGVTGRKIIADTYGGASRHGGGAFSGKDPTKVDRSGAYKCRHVAKKIVASGMADRCEIQVAYAIGIAEPVSLMFETFGTAHATETEIRRAIEQESYRPRDIINEFNLLAFDYTKVSAYGHFGREGLPWETI